MNPQARFRQHLIDRGSSPKAAWISSVLLAGLKPGLKVLEPVEADGARVELRWIRRLHRRGFELVNVHGTGRPRRPRLTSPIPRDRSPETLHRLWKERSPLLPMRLAVVENLV